MSLPKASTRIGLFALLLSVIVLSLFSGLVAADRALVIADRESTALDARGAALVLERELRLRAAPLAELSGPLSASPARPSPPLAADSTTRPSGFAAVWVVDTSGRVAWSGGDTAGVSHRAIDAAARTPPVRRVDGGVEVSVFADTTGSLLIAVPLWHRGQLLGAAIARMTGAAVLSVLHAETRSRRWVALLSPGGRIASLGGDTAGVPLFLDTARVELPGDPLRVQIGHEPSGRALRTALWLFGIVGLSTLLGGLYRERRHTMQLGTRTAELERLYQEVARSNRMKSEFLANVSHELRTPLNAVVGFVEMLREGVYGELTPRQALPVDRIAASATHLRHLVDRLLDIAKIAAGRLEVHTEPLVLRPFVLNVASEMESLVSERGLTLTIGVAPTLPRIRTDQTHLRQILINLIGNAVKYTPSGNIDVRAGIVGDGATMSAPDETENASSPFLPLPPNPQRAWIALQVKDSGVGIALSDQERIFDEFEQVNAGARTDSARRGTGLGLAISRRLSRLLGGDLTVVSELGRGSTFTVWLPLGENETK
jgi:signal transduction histidine kinase